MAISDKHKQHETVGVPVVYTVQSITRMRERFEPGQQFTIRKPQRGSTNLIDGSGQKYARYTVVRVFSHHVSCLDKQGQRESFGFLELAEEAKMM